MSKIRRTVTVLTQYVIDCDEDLFDIDIKVIEEGIRHDFDPQLPSIRNKKISIISKEIVEYSIYRDPEFRGTPVKKVAYNFGPSAKSKNTK